MEIYFKQLHPDAKLPHKAHEDDGAYDARACEAGIIMPHTFQAVKLGFSMELPLGSACLVLPRSGLAAKHGVTVLNAPGLIDCGYRGEVKALLINHSDEPFSYKAGDRVAQLMPIRIENAALIWSEDLSQSVRGTGGFGSSGTD